MTLTAEQWREVQRVFALVVETPGSDAGALIGETFRDDERVASELQRLLAAREAGTPFAATAFGATQLERLHDQGLLPAAMSLRPGDVLLGRFEIVEQVGQGGMGQVFCARDLQLDRRVALKLLRRYEEQSPSVVRFLHEARISGRLEHPAILGLHELLQLESGEPLLVLPFVSGRTLGEVLAREPERWSPRRRVEVVRRVGEALAFAHSEGVLHRDLKPSNIMVRGARRGAAHGLGPRASARRRGGCRGRILRCRG